MRNSSTTDCVLIGYNDIDFAKFAQSQKEMQSQSGAYHEIKTNSLILDGQRVTYMEAINRAIEQSSGSNPGLNVFEAPLQSVCYLANYLQKRDFQVEVVNFFTYEKERLKRILEERPLSVAITTTFYIDHAPIVEIVEFVRQHSPETRIIVGGPHVFNLFSDLDEETRSYVFETLLAADVYIIDSQGEKTLGDLLRCLVRGAGLDAVSNLHYRTGDGTFQSTRREIEKNDLDENSIDWTYFDRELVAPIAYLRTARSCPYTCSFCNYPTMAGAYVNSRIESVEEELRALHRVGTTDIVFIDDTFNYPLPRFKRLLSMMIENRFNFRWVSFLRCANIDEEGLDLMKESGCVGVLLGIESGDERILGLMNKAAKPERYRWGIAELNKREIVSFASLICGFPGETKESIEKTIGFIDETQPTFFNVQLYYHDMRAPVQRRASELGIGGGGYNWRHNSMDWKEAVGWAEYMFKQVRGSIPLSLYGFSLWGIAYLIAQGISMDQIKAFGRIARPILLDGFSDQGSQDFSDNRAEMVKLFANTQLKQRKRRVLTPAPAQFT